MPHVRVVQKGRSNWVVILFYIGPLLDDSLRRAAGPEPHILATEMANPQESLAELVLRYAKVPGASIVLGAVGPGCQGVLSRMEDPSVGPKVMGLLLCDGVNAPFCEEHPEKAAEGCELCQARSHAIWAWQPFISRAKRAQDPSLYRGRPGDLFKVVLTHTYENYVERIRRGRCASCGGTGQLPIGRIHNVQIGKHVIDNAEMMMNCQVCKGRGHLEPTSSTVAVARALTEWDLPIAATRPAGVAWRAEGGLEVGSYASETIDEKAAAAQASVALPEGLSRFVPLWQVLEARPVEEPGGE